MKIKRVKDVKVELIAGGGKCYTAIAARFCRSNKSVKDILASEYSHKLVENIVNSGHLAATEFDTFIFGIDGASRVFEAQLIRKRLASYMISSGRVDRTGGDREIVLPDDDRIFDVEGTVDGNSYNIMKILELLDSWYLNAVESGISPNDARYLMPEGSAKKIILSMNSHALIDWFKIRCCFRAAPEINSVANQILHICKEQFPDIFKDAGPSCKVLGFCPEHEQCEQMKGKILPLKEVKAAAREGRLVIQ